MFAFFKIQKLTLTKEAIIYRFCVVRTVLLRLKIHTKEAD